MVDCGAGESVPRAPEAHRIVAGGALHGTHRLGRVGVLRPHAQCSHPPRGWRGPGRLCTSSCTLAVGPLADPSNDGPRGVRGAYG